MSPKLPGAPRTRIKICGITSPEDAAAAIAAGADALGFAFWAGSKRYLAPADAAGIIAGLAPFVTTVGLFVDESVDGVCAARREAGFDLVQFHGNESPEHCAAVGAPYYKAVRMRDDVDLVRLAAEHAAARALLLDAYRPGQPGGTGVVFDWNRVPDSLGLPVVLAGGLDAGNVADAIATVRPYAVDVSGGVERGPGNKDAAAMNQFCSEVRRVC